ncbi:MAG: 6-bladed beta-propeller [Mediterranea massiliensis]|nr:6-bladed beta-propeller [Mediterranea massiliensis]
MYRYFIFYLSVLFLLSCNERDERKALSFQVKGSDTLFVCDLNRIEHEKVRINLSDWVDEFRWIQLDSADTATIIGQEVYITDNYIGMLDNQRFKLFNHAGQFLCDIGRVGQGPGEYTVLYSAALDEKRNRIYLAPFGHNKVWIYNFQGNSIEDMNMPLLTKGVIRSMSDGSLLMTHLNFGKSMQYFQIDTLGLKTFTSDMSKVVVTRTPSGDFIGYNNEIYLRNNTKDFIYHIYPSFSDSLFCFNPQSRKSYTRLTLNNLRSRYITITETPSAFFIRFISGITNIPTKWIPTSEVIIADKKRETACFADIRNDYLGGIAVTSQFALPQSGWYYEVLEPIQLLEMINNRLDEPDCTNEDKTRLKQLKNSFDKNGNNLLLYGKIR